MIVIREIQAAHLSGGGREPTFNEGARLSPQRWQITAHSRHAECDCSHDLPARLFNPRQRMGGSRWTSPGHPSATNSFGPLSSARHCISSRVHDANHSREYAVSDRSKWFKSFCGSSVGHVDEHDRGRFPDERKSGARAAKTAARAARLPVTVIERLRWKKIKRVPADIADAIREAVERHNEESLARAKHEAFIARRQAEIIATRLGEIDGEFYGPEIDRLRNLGKRHRPQADRMGGA